MKNKNKDKNSNARSMFECPAFSDKTKKTFFFTSPMSVEYEYDFTDPENSYIIPKNPLMPYLETKILRPPTINKQPLFQLSLFYCFLAKSRSLLLLHRLFCITLILQNKAFRQLDLMI